MLYRENGQFKVSYAEDQQILPIVQDRWFMLALLAFAYLVMPAIASDYFFLSLVTPFLILAIAAMLLAAQILLGALTVWKLLAPWTVTAHLVTGNSFAANARAAVTMPFCSLVSEKSIAVLSD